MPAVPRRKPITSVSQIVTMPDLAARFGKKESTVRQWVLSGKLQGFRLGDGPRSTLVTTEDFILEMLNSSKPIRR